MRTEKKLSVHNCLGESALQKYPVVSSSKAVGVKPQFKAVLHFVKGRGFKPNNFDDWKKDDWYE